MDWVLRRGVEVAFPTRMAARNVVAAAVLAWMTG